MFRSYDHLQVIPLHISVVWPSSGHTTETCSGYWIKYSKQCCVRRKPWTWRKNCLLHMSIHLISDLTLRYLYTGEIDRTSCKKISKFLLKSIYNFFCFRNELCICKSTTFTSHMSLHKLQELPFFRHTCYLNMHKLYYANLYYHNFEHYTSLKVGCLHSVACTRCFSCVLFKSWSGDGDRTQSQKCRVL
jgi:hypothetical protein